MRTTVTLEDRVERLIRQAMAERGQSFKVVLNEAIERGLADFVYKDDEPPFVVEAFSLGPVLPPYRGMSINQINDELEIEEFLAKEARIRAQEQQRRAGRGAAET